MSMVIRKYFEYDLVCDECGVEQVLHTGDGEREYVHNMATALKEAQFHKNRGKLLCSTCFAKRRTKGGKG